MTTSEYLLSCKIAKLSIQELELITIGMALDHCEEWAVARNPELRAEKEATQADIQRFKGR